MGPQISTHVPLPMRSHPQTSFPIHPPGFHAHQPSQMYLPSGRQPDIFVDNSQGMLLRYDQRNRDPRFDPTVGVPPGKLTKQSNNTYKKNLETMVLNRDDTFSREFHH